MMINCLIHTIREEGKRTIALTIPCFSGKDDGNTDRDFYAAARMNRFYSHAADELYRYSSTIPEEGLRRLTFICRTSAEFTEDGIIEVRMTLSLCRLPIKGRCPAVQKCLMHRWRGGILTK